MAREAPDATPGRGVTVDAEPTTQVAEPVEQLLAAFGRRERRALEVLAARGVSLESRDANQRTVLMRAAESGATEALQWILQAGAEVDARLPDGRVALMLAAARGQEGAVELLLAGGADPQLQDRQGQTAADWADAVGDSTLAHRLRRTGQDSTSRWPRDTPWGRRSRESGLDQARGLGALDSDDRAVLVDAPVARVASTLAASRPGAHWHRDAYGHDVTTTHCCFVVFRFRRHRWTLVREAHLPQRDNAMALGPSRARQLSLQLACEALWVDHRPSVNRFGLCRFDRGRFREGTGDLPDADLDPHGDAWLDRVGDDPQRSLHRRLCQLDAWAPSWGRRRGALHRLEIAGLTADDFDRLDFVAFPDRAGL